MSNSFGQRTPKKADHEHNGNPEVTTHNLVLNGPREDRAEDVRLSTSSAYS